MSDHDIYKLLLNVQDSLSSMDTKIEQRFDTLSSKLECMEANYNKMKKVIDKIDACGMSSSHPMGGGGLMPNFSKIDNKEEYLNHNVNNVISCDLLQHLRSEAKTHITYQHVYDILKKSYGIYDFVSMIIQMIVGNGPSCLYAFPFQKHVIYYWNNEKGTWEKMSTNLLRNVFNIIQQELVIVYNKLIQQLQSENKFHQKSAAFMENGMLIFADDFESKYKNFKKMLFDKLCN